MTLQKVFIDGEAGTTGLQIAARLADRDDLELIQIDPAARKDLGPRAAALNAADVAILCLPDDAARDAVALVTNPTTRIIDASSAHRVSPGWVYGFPELDGQQRSRILQAERISNPGCYAIAAVSMLRPLIAAGAIPANWPVSLTGLSGYSGGGKALINSFENSDSADAISSANYHYALTLAHKHVPEITRWSGLTNAPIFLPTVGRYYKGMLVSVPLPLWALPGALSPQDIRDILRAHYDGEPYVAVANEAETLTTGRLEPEALNDSNELRLHVLRDAANSQVVVVAQLDNLGKGASGQAVQTLNLLLNVDEGSGLSFARGS
ncbi:MAG: N-acetyl-gamma-glutamyl-phosphate reductase [Gammaproteobacteria bacterium]|jgi:N-acetyl-gamma-glutamyl-phosphate reductase